MAPCVLWVDEIEKALSTGHDEAGVSRRILATLLTWMSENSKAVFIVATANAIDRLPPELIRKGRMDEIFFVDLPEFNVRRDIFRIHLAQRDLDCGKFDVDQLGEKSAGFSGAEIEQAIVSALYSARATNESLDTAHLLAELERTKPLSVVMGEQIAALRAWAAGRTVPA